MFKRSLMRRGFLDFNWFWLSFFFLIVVIALALLFIQKDALRPEREQLGEDFANQRANAVLTSALRLPARLDIDGDGVEEDGTLAQLIATNTGQYDDRIRKALQDALAGDWYYDVKVSYPGGRTLEAQNAAAQLTQTRQLGEGGALLPCPGGTVHLTLEITTYPKSDERKEIDRLVQQSQTRSGGGLGA